MSSLGRACLGNSPLAPSFDPPPKPFSDHLTKVGPNISRGLGPPKRSIIFVVQRNSIGSPSSWSSFSTAKPTIDGDQKDPTRVYDYLENFLQYSFTNLIKKIKKSLSLINKLINWRRHGFFSSHVLRTTFCDFCFFVSRSNELGSDRIGSDRVRPRLNLLLGEVHLFNQLKILHESV